MLNTIILNNIKSFKEESKINLSNITLLYGNNSVGKSTIWKFLMMLQQTYKVKENHNYIIQSSLNLTDPTFFADRKTLSFDPKKEIYFTIKNYYSKNISFTPNNGVGLKIVCKNSAAMGNPNVEVPNLYLIKERSQTFQNMENEIKEINQSNLKLEIKEEKIRKNKKRKLCFLYYMSVCPTLFFFLTSTRSKREPKGALRAFVNGLPESENFLPILCLFVARGLSIV